MRVLLSTYGSRGDVEPMVGLAVRLRGLGVEVRVCAPPNKDCAERPAEVGVPLVPDSDHRVPLSAALRTTLTPETRARATAVAGTIRTDGATVAATLLLDRS